MKRWTTLSADEIAAKSAANRAARTTKAPLCKCGKTCQIDGYIGGHRASCRECNEKHAKQNRESRARIKQERATARPKGKVKSEGEETLAAHLKAHKIGGWEREYRFAPPRRWRADFAFPVYDLLVEVEGGLWIKGRHQTGTGYQADLEKYNAATMLRWRVLRFSTQQVKSGEAVKTISEFLDTCCRPVKGA